jgi:heme A synthase
MNSTAEQTHGLTDLFRQLRDDAARLVREEVALAKAETVEKLPTLYRNLGYLAAGALTGFSALIVVLIGLGWAMREVFLERGMSESIATFLGLLIVGIVVGIVSAGLVSKAISALKHTSLKPAKTVQTIKEDKDWVQNKL